MKQIYDFILLLESFLTGVLKVPTKVFWLIAAAMTAVLVYAFYAWPAVTGYIASLTTFLALILQKKEQ